MFLFFISTVGSAEVFFLSGLLGFFLFCGTFCQCSAKVFICFLLFEMYVQSDILFEGLCFETHGDTEKAELVFNTPCLSGI